MNDTPQNPLIPVEELLRKITHSGDFTHREYGLSWEKIINLFLNQEPKKMRRLCSSIMDRGFLNEGAINVFEGGYHYTIPHDQWEMANGHHRFVAALLLGLEAIPVRFNVLRYPEHLWGKYDHHEFYKSY